MPAHSEDQAKLMRLVRAVQRGKTKDVTEPAKSMAKDMKPKEVEDMMTTEELQKLKELIRQTIREMNVTGNVQGYLTPKAFAKPGMEKKKAKRQADLTGYSVVNESADLDKKTLLKIFNIPNNAERVGVKKEKYGYTIKYDDPKTGAQNTSFLSQTRIDNYLSGKLKEIVNENRWLELKKEDIPAKAKIGRGLSTINKQLNEMERFLNWYGRLKQENGMSNQDFWKRTNHNIYKIKERLIKLEQNIRKISE